MGYKKASHLSGATYPFHSVLHHEKKLGSYFTDITASLTLLTSLKLSPKNAQSIVDVNMKKPKPFLDFHVTGEEKYKTKNYKTFCDDYSV